MATLQICLYIFKPPTLISRNVLMLIGDQAWQAKKCSSDKSLTLLSLPPIHQSRGKKYPGVGNGICTRQLEITVKILLVILVFSSTKLDFFDFMMLSVKLRLQKSFYTFVSCIVEHFIRAYFC